MTALTEASGTKSTIADGTTGDGDRPLRYQLLQPAGQTRWVWTMPRLIAAVLMTLAGIWVTQDAWLDIYTIAQRDEEASHIFLVPIVFGWLVWVRRGRFRNCRPVGNLVGPVLVAVGWAMSSMGYHQAIQSFWHGGALLTTIGCLVTVVGVEVIWRFLPAFAVLAFVVPVPGMFRQEVSLPLQRGVAVATSSMLELMNVPVYRFGSTLHVNDVPVNIVEACNGMRMVFALVLVSYAFAFGTPLRTHVRLIILIASPISAMLCNVIRLVPTAWIHGFYNQPYNETVFGQLIPYSWLESLQIFGHYSDPKFGDVFHDGAGWGMLILAFLLLMGIIRVLRWALVPVERYNLAYN